MKPWDVFDGSDSVALLNEEDCAKTCDTVFAAKEHWALRQAGPNQAIQFYTLGAASYLDAKMGEYETQREKTAAYLTSHFGELYRRLCAILRGVLSLPCQISTELAPPGFHIFRGHEQSRPGLAFGGSIHRDLQYVLHKEKVKSVDDILSFTLPVALPKGGGGMYYWTEVCEFDMCGFVFQKGPEERQWLESHKRQIDYRVGDLYLHSGKTPHQLAAFTRSERDDWRITMQGHGILCEGTWHLYF